MTSVVADVHVAAARGAGLLVGHVAGTRMLLLHLAPEVEGVPLREHREQLQRGLVGGLSVVGVYSERSDASAVRRLVVDCFGGGVAPAHVYSLRVGVTPLTVTVYPVMHGQWGEAVAHPVSSAPLLAHSTLLVAPLNVHLAVTAAASASLGDALEATAVRLAERVHRQVAVTVERGARVDAAVVRVPVWTLRNHGVWSDDATAQPALLAAHGSVTGLALVHTDCTQEQCQRYLLDDLGHAAIVTRVKVFLDELDAMDEEAQGVAHVLRRRGASSPPPQQCNVDAKARWTLPRRVLVRDGAGLPWVDWQMAWEYDGRDSVARALETAGLKGEVVADATLEGPPGHAQLTLDGLPEQPHAPSKAAVAAVTRSAPARAPPARQQPVLFVYLAAIAVLVALLAWRLSSPQVG